MKGGAECRSWTLSVTPGGASFLTWASKRGNRSFGSWSGTSRMLTLADANEGSTVFAPSPM